MKNISFDHIFESDAAKIVKKHGSSNTKQIEHLKRTVALIIKEELTKKQREILDMYFFRGMNCTQIAKTLKVNKSTISRTKSRGLATIAKMLKYYNFR